ncbi:MAG TPA: substrate-binding domain-containing protein, partial [Galbitalea sp.]|nr:substrate-binding domain-containing protein [Galbitalea sp.]
MSYPIGHSGHGSRKKFVTLAKALPILGVAVLLAACSSGTPTSKGTAAGGSSNGSAKNINIVVIGGTSDDPFFSTVKNGVDAAAKSIEAAGGKVTYLSLANYNNLGPDTAKLEATALSLHPSAVAVPDWVPTAQDPNLKAISAAGIPLVIYNSGTIDNAKSVGAFTYIGGDYTLSGVAGGKEFVNAGAKNVVFVNTVPGDASSEEFSTGYKQAMTAAGDKYTELNLPASSFGNATAVAQAIKSELLNNPSVDGIATYGVQDASSAASAISQASAG